MDKQDTQDKQDTHTNKSKLKEDNKKLIEDGKIGSFPYAFILSEDPSAVWPK